MSRDHQKLAVFDLAQTVVLDIYRLTECLPATERYGLQSQLRRAAVSTVTNIVEGCARRSEREYASFVNVAAGSSAETEYLVELSVKLGLLDGGECVAIKDRLNHLVRSLKALRNSLEQHTGR